MLPISDPLDMGMHDIAEAAREAERSGADSVWVGDHLAFHIPVIEAIVALTTAAAVTEHVRLGFGVLLLALRHPAWAAKQVSSLQVVSNGRVELGVGVGGEYPAEWAAAGVPFHERGIRTDRILESLPSLLSGKPSDIAAPYHLPVPALAPATTTPPLWVGGRSEHALRRAAQFGDGWYGMFAEPARVALAQERLAAWSSHFNRPRPRIGLLVFAHVGEPAQGRDEVARFLHGHYRIPFEKVERYTAIGSVDDVAAKLRELAHAGVDDFVLYPAAVNPIAQYEPLAHVRVSVTEHLTAGI